VISNWHALRAQRGAEAATARRLREVVENGFVPMQRQDGGLHALWPTYVFGKWSTVDPYAWHRAHDAIGVSGILMANGSEMPMVVSPPGLVDGWIEIADEFGVVPGLAPPDRTINFGHLVGKAVRLLDGLTGTVLRIDDRQWAVVETEMFGRPQQVAVPAIGLIATGDAAPLRKKKTRRGRRRRWKHRRGGQRPITVVRV
jgi:hypothetical protein